jgi:hypothetical protein
MDVDVASERGLGRPRTRQLLSGNDRCFGGVANAAGASSGLWSAPDACRSHESHGCGLYATDHSYEQFYTREAPCGVNPSSDENE